MRLQLGKLNALLQVFFSEFPQAGPMALTAVAALLAKFGAKVDTSTLLVIVGAVEVVLRGYAAKSVAKVKKS